MSVVFYFLIYSHWWRSTAQCILDLHLKHLSNAFCRNSSECCSLNGQRFGADLFWILCSQVFQGFIISIPSGIVPVKPLSVTNCNKRKSIKRKPSSLFQVIVACIIFHICSMWKRFTPCIYVTDIVMSCHLVKLTPFFQILGSLRNKNRKVDKSRKN